MTEDLSDALTLPSRGKGTETTGRRMPVVPKSLEYERQTKDIV